MILRLSPKCLTMIFSPTKQDSCIEWLCIVSILPLFSLNISPRPFFSGYWLFEDTKLNYLKDIPATSAGMPLFWCCLTSPMRSCYNKQLLKLCIYCKTVVEDRPGMIPAPYVCSMWEILIGVQCQERAVLSLHEWHFGFFWMRARKRSVSFCSKIEWSLVAVVL